MFKIFDPDDYVMPDPFPEKVNKTQAIDALYAKYRALSTVPNSLTVTEDTALKLLGDCRKQQVAWLSVSAWVPSDRTKRGFWEIDDFGEYVKMIYYTECNPNWVNENLDHYENVIKNEWPWEDYPIMGVLLCGDGCYYQYP